MSDVELIKVGDTAPGFDLEGTGGARRQLADLLRRGHVLLVFYPGNDTPG